MLMPGLFRNTVISQHSLELRKESFACLYHTPLVSGIGGTDLGDLCHLYRNAYVAG
jgi:hypothetical protein